MPAGYAVTGLSKVCDAADWFEPEFQEIVREELRETLRFHRKQWEFAMIFRALRHAGLLGPDRSGLSMGGGRERLLYAVARRVRRLVVTDLYDVHTTWTEARTDDPQAFVLGSMPFPVEPGRLQALRMDMRRLDFPDASFDFAYSACAVEHIGEWPDFVRHLAQVHRVLRPGGVYAFTTEFHYGPETIEHPGNYVFSAAFLNALFAASPFVPEPVCLSALAPHRANLPLPGNIHDLRLVGANHLGASLLSELPHVQLLRGHLPHASALFVLRKTPAVSKEPVAFPGLEASLEFLAQGIADYRRWVESSRFGLDPLGYLPGRSSPFVGGNAPLPASARTVFHTEYVWLGGGRRSFSAMLRPRPGAAPRAGELDLRVHRFPTLGRIEVDCPAATILRCSGVEPLRGEVTVDADPECCYALLAHLREGEASFEQVEVSTSPANP